MKVSRIVRYEVICPNCGAKIEFNLEEVKENRSATDWGKYLTCPICKTMVQTHYGYYAFNEFILCDKVKVTYGEQEECDTE